MNNYVLYAIDVETCGLDPIKHDVIELSIIRLLDNEQKTWCIKPLKPENIEAAALRVNHHKLEDITHQTKYGRDTYLDPNQVIIDVENWLANDNCTTANRVLLAQNTAFDKSMLEQLWIKCNSFDSFPFGRRYLDTMQIEFFLNLCEDKMLEGYSLSNIIKKYGIRNEKSHTAASDTKAVKEVFEKQVQFFKTILAKQ